jgi:hypothetical protein
MDRIALVHAIAKVSIELIAICFHSFEIFIIQIGEMSFWMILKKLMREINVRALVLQYHPESICTSAQTSISRTTMRWPNLILKVVSSKNN